MNRIEKRRADRANSWTLEPAFTLIEALVVVAVLAVLMALLIPLFSKMGRESRATACLSNLRQLGAGLSGYLAENDMTMPTLRGGRKSSEEDVPVIDNTLNRHITEKRLFVCPGDDRGLAGATGTSYYWNTALNGQKFGSLTFLKFSDEQSRIPILSDKEGFHPDVKDRVNILYADGHATKELKFWEEKP